MVRVQVQVAERVDEVARLESGDLGNHEGQQGVTGDVEGDTEEEIGAALVELAAQFAFGHVKLEKRVARRQCHLMDLGRIPRGDQQATTVRVVPDLVHQPFNLVDRTSVTAPPIVPLRPIDPAQISVRPGPFVPDGHAPLLQPPHIGLPTQEPQQLVDDGLQVDLLGRHQRKSVRQPVPGLGTEQTVRPGPGPIRLETALLKDQPKEFVIRAHGISATDRSLN